MNQLPYFGIRSVPPCRDCYDGGNCSMNCGPRLNCECCHHGESLNGDWKIRDKSAFCSVACMTYHGNKTCGCFTPVCKECSGLTYVLREFGEIACPECQPEAYADQISNIWLGY